MGCTSICKFYLEEDVEDALRVGGDGGVERRAARVVGGVGVEGGRLQQLLGGVGAGVPGGQVQRVLARLVHLQFVTSVTRCDHV